MSTPDLWCGKSARTMAPTKNSGSSTMGPIPSWSHRPALEQTPLQQWAPEACPGSQGHEDQKLLEEEKGKAGKTKNNASDLEESKGEGGRVFLEFSAGIKEEEMLRLSCNKWLRMSLPLRNF